LRARQTDANRVILAGNITRNPEIRITGQGVPVCSFGLAVNRVRSKNKDAVDFFDVSVWREQGEAVANHKRKGDPVLVEGRLQYRSWEDRESGQKRSKVDVVAESVQFLGGGAGNGSSEALPTRGGASASPLLSVRGEWAP
jgi:single-strand DNA-binding protein